MVQSVRRKLILSPQLLLFLLLWWPSKHRGVGIFLSKMPITSILFLFSVACGATDVTSGVENSHNKHVRRRRTQSRRRQRQDAILQQLNRDIRIPKPYPMIFQIEFVTNITSASSLSLNNHQQQQQRRQQQAQQQDYPINGTLYYDWTQRAQRIDHGPGSYECVKFYHTDSECTLLFLKEGMYRILPPTTDDDDLCCLDLPNIGTPPPNWASQIPSTWNGLIWDEYNQVLTSEWWFDKSYLNDYYHRGSGRTTTTSTNDDFDNDNNTTSTATFPFHTARQVVSFGRGSDDDGDDYDGRPVVFTFPGMANGRQDMHYLYHTMKNVIPDSKRTSLFELPDGCQYRLCSKQQQQARIE